MNRQWSPETETRYQRKLEAEGWTAYRLVTWLGAVLFPLGFGLDWFTQRPAAFKLSVIRLVITLIDLTFYVFERRGIRPLKNAFAACMLMACTASSIWAMASCPSVWPSGIRRTPAVTKLAL